MRGFFDSQTSWQEKVVLLSSPCIYRHVQSAFDIFTALHILQILLLSLGRMPFCITNIAALSTHGGSTLYGVSHCLPRGELACRPGSGMIVKLCNGTYTPRADDRQDENWRHETVSALDSPNS